MSIRTTSGTKSGVNVKRGGLFMEVKMNCTSTIGAQPSGLYIERWPLDAGGIEGKFHYYCTGKS